MTTPIGEQDPTCPGCGFLASQHRKEIPLFVMKRTPEGLRVDATPSHEPIYVCPKPKRKRKP